MTFPPELGHRVVLVAYRETASEVRIIVGRVSGYSCTRVDDGSVRTIAVHRDSIGTATFDLDQWIAVDLDERYTYTEGVMGDVLLAVRRAVSDLAEALLPPKAAVPAEPVAVQADEPVAVEPVAKGGE